MFSLKEQIDVLLILSTTLASRCIKIKKLESIFLFYRIQMLDISFNNLSKNDVLMIGALRNLKRLNISGNNLGSLSEEMSYPMASNNETRLKKYNYNVLPEAYLGEGHWAMAPLWQKNFFWHSIKIGKLGLAPPFVWALVSSEHLAPPFWNPKYATVSYYPLGIRIRNSQVLLVNYLTIKSKWLYI